MNQAKLVWLFIIISLLIVIGVCFGVWQQSTRIERINVEQLK